MTPKEGNEALSGISPLPSGQGDMDLQRVIESLQDRIEEQRLELEKKTNKIAALQRNFENMSKNSLDTSGETADLERRLQKMSRELADVTKELHQKVPALSQIPT